MVICTLRGGEADHKSVECRSKGIGVMIQRHWSNSILDGRIVKGAATFNFDFNLDKKMCYPKCNSKAIIICIKKIYIYFQ